MLCSARRAMKDFMVVVSTCPRPGADYLRETLAGLDRAGAADLPKLVLSDGPLRRGCARRPESLSRRAYLWAASRTAVAAGVERLLYFEDDIAPCTNAVLRMLAI